MGVHSLMICLSSLVVVTFCQESRMDHDLSIHVHLQRTVPFYNATLEKLTRMFGSNGIKLTIMTSDDTHVLNDLDDINDAFYDFVCDSDVHILATANYTFSQDIQHHGDVNGIYNMRDCTKPGYVAMELNGYLTDPYLMAHYIVHTFLETHGRLTWRKSDDIMDNVSDWTKKLDNLTLYTSYTDRIKEFIDRCNSLD